MNLVRDRRLKKLEKLYSEYLKSVYQIVNIFFKLYYMLF